MKNGEIYVWTVVKNSQIELVTNKTFHIGPFKTVRFTARTAYVSDNGSEIRVLDANKNVLNKVGLNGNRNNVITDLDVSSINQQVFLSFFTWGCGYGSGGSHTHPIYINKIEFLT